MYSPQTQTGRTDLKHPITGGHLNDSSQKTAHGLNETPPSDRLPPEAEGLSRIEPKDLLDLEGRVERFLSVILSEPTQSAAFKARIEGVHRLAHEEMSAAGRIPNRLLELQHGPDFQLSTDKETVSESLESLRKILDHLDPNRNEIPLAPRRILGLLLPGNSATRNYFRRYDSAQSRLNEILESLRRGQDELRRDNASLEEEKQEAEAIMGSLEKYVYIARRIDSALESKLEALDHSDPEKSRIVREEVLFYIRQKLQDLLTQLAVTLQGFLAMELIRRNNQELIKGVDRATTTTLSALRTAVIVAQALGNQKLVLDQVGTLSAKTSSLIASTAEKLRQQAGTLSNQATAPTIGMEELKAAFVNLYAAMDEVDRFKLEALASMKDSIGTLQEELHRARIHIDRHSEATDHSPLGSESSGEELNLLRP